MCSLWILLTHCVQFVDTPDILCAVWGRPDTLCAVFYEEEVVRTSVLTPRNLGVSDLN